MLSQRVFVIYGVHRLSDVGIEKCISNVNTGLSHSNITLANITRFDSQPNGSKLGEARVSSHSRSKFVLLLDDAQTIIVRASLELHPRETGHEDNDHHKMNTVMFRVC